jgi:tRNA (mo5U34)-methyltransferase
LYGHFSYDHSVQASGQLPQDQLRAQAEKIIWYHTMDLGGVRTKGSDNTSLQLERIRIPESLAGLTVLDVGAWDGFYSFEAERRGAKRVLATDWQAWRSTEAFGWGTGKAGFEFARRVLGSRVEDREIDVQDISRETVGMFDVVFFLGVLYHLKDPLGALERVAGVTKKLLIVETAVDLMRVRRPAMAFYPRKELNGDPTNWFGPNVACVEAMLRACGFRQVRCVSRHSWWERVGTAAMKKIRGEAPFFASVQRGRAAFHAIKDA